MFALRKGASTLAIIACALATLVEAQVQRNEIPAASITTAAPQLAARSASPSSRELTVRWTISPLPGNAQQSRASLDAADQQFDVASLTTVNAGMVLERAPQLSVDRLLVMAAGKDGDFGWQLIADPRVIRAEAPGPDGTLSGQVLYRPETNFIVSLPAGLAVTALRIYDIDWVGGAFVLHQLGTLDVPAQ